MLEQEGDSDLDRTRAERPNLQIFVCALRNVQLYNAMKG